MTDFRVTLRKVGFAFVAFGLADIAFMVYTISQGNSYSSSFNILAVIAGVFLIRGSLGATRLVTWLSAFMLAGFIGAILFLFPFVQPFGLLVVQAKLNPMSFAITSLMAVAFLGLLGWSYRQLRSSPVLLALRESGRSIATPKLAIGLGLALVAFLSVTLNVTLNGAAGEKAVNLAREKLGSRYSYATQNIHWSGGHTGAVVAAYNDHEIQYISVEWSE